MLEREFGPWRVADTSVWNLPGQCITGAGNAIRCLSWWDFAKFYPEPDLNAVAFMDQIGPEDASPLKTVSLFCCSSIFCTDLLSYLRPSLASRCMILYCFSWLFFMSYHVLRELKRSIYLSHLTYSFYCCDKMHDQKQILKENVYLSLWFWSVTHTWQWNKGMAAETTMYSHLKLPVGGREAHWEW